MLKKFLPWKLKNYNEIIPTSDETNWKCIFAHMYVDVQRFNIKFYVPHGLNPWNILKY